MTEKEILQQLLDQDGFEFDSFLDKKEIQDLYVQLSNVDGFAEYLRALMNNYVKLYFSSADEDVNAKAQAKGAYRAIAYIRKNVISAPEKEKVKSDLKTQRHKGVA